MGEDDNLQLWLQNARFIIFPLLQYPNSIKDQAEKMSMDGENILKACRMLQIEYSKFTNLPTGDTVVDHSDVTSNTGQGAYNQI